jgi:hypothetical protein
MDSNEIEKSNYSSVRTTLSASKLVDKVVGKISPISSTPFGAFIQITAKVVKSAIYVEDWINTDKEIGRRIKDVLNSAQVSGGVDHPELYKQFQEYVKISLKSWVPDRDYPQIGYLPKKFLYNLDLGEKEITKYWPESNQEQRDKYVALTLNELALNYELLWNSFICENTSE